MNGVLKRNRMNHAILLTLAVAPALSFAATDIESSEIVVSATKTEKLIQDVPASVGIVDAQEASRYGHTSIADMIQDIPGVEVFDNSVAGSKRLMIRGESGDRVLILVDGQKINEQKSMDGAPLLIDPATVERIEVVKGAGSVLYGSEAIGGVVNIITKKGGDKPIGGSFSTIYSSGTDGLNTSASAHGKINGFQYRLSGSQSDQGDRKTPSGTLKGSDSEMKSFSGFMGYTGKSFDTGLTVEKYQVAADVPRILLNGLPFDLNLPEWSREKVGGYLDITDINDYLTKVHIDAYTQKTNKDFEQYMEIDMGLMGITQMNMQTFNEQKTKAANLQLDILATEEHYLITGLAYSKETLYATTDVSFNRFFIPPKSYFHDANIASYAIYLQDEWTLPSDFTLTLGARNTWVRSELSDSDDENASIGSVSDSHLAFSSGLIWGGIDNLTLRGLYSQGYRFPDLVKLFTGTSHGGSVTLPNPNLKPETSDNFELGARYNDDHFTADITLFNNRAKNYINAKSIGGGYNQYENVDKAFTYGLETWLGYRFDEYNLTPYVNATIMRRKYENAAFSTWKTNTPLLSGRAGLRFNQALQKSTMKLWGDLYLRTASKAETENEDTDTDEETITTKDGWHTVNFAFGTTWGENDSCNASLNINNILDESYYTAQNNLEEVGFNVVASVAISF